MLESYTADPLDWAAQRAMVWRLTLCELDAIRMSRRQRDDLRTGLALLTSALTPDSYFDGHPDMLGDSVDSMMDRIAVIVTRTELEDLPEVPHHDPN